MNRYIGAGLVWCAQLGGATACAGGSLKELYSQRVDTVRQVPGLVAFWDFVQREDGIRGQERFCAYTAPGDTHRYVLEPHNLSWDYWHEGRPATLVDFPLLGRGPFGQAVHFSAPGDDLSLLPVLMVPRSVLQDTPLDIKGPGQSISMVTWLIYQGGNHAIAGIWHEGTTTPRGTPALVRETGRRQFALFAGMGGNPGASGVHVSENGLGSFGDDYARHLAVTPGKLETVPLDADDATLDAGWSTVGFVFDAETKVVTAYLNGVAEERWVASPAKDRFYRAAARAWLQAQLAKVPGLQEGEDPEFPRDQFYDPPMDEILQEEVEHESARERVVVRTYAFTKVRVMWRKDAAGVTASGPPERVELAALKTNPYWFGHAIFAPSTIDEGGPFTIGRVIHSGRGGKLTAYLGGVAVYDRTLSPDQMQRLAAIVRPAADASEAVVLSFDEISREVP